MTASQKAVASSRSHSHAGGAVSDCPAIYASRYFATKGRPDLLRARYLRPVSAGRTATSIAPSRAKSRPISRLGTHQVRIGHQSQDYEDSWHHGAALVAGARRRERSNKGCLAAIAHGSLWHLSSVAARPDHVGDWSMLLKKVFRGVERIFSEALVPWSENDVGGHIISPISNQRPS